MKSQLLYPLKFVALYLVVFSLLRWTQSDVFQYIQHIISLLIVSATIYLNFRLRSHNLIAFLTTIICLLLAFILASTLSMNIDRSKSVQILLLTQESQHVGKDILEILKDKGITEPHLIQSFSMRLEEQNQFGMITGGRKNPKLTVFGSLFLHLADTIAHVWKLEGYRKW